MVKHYMSSLFDDQLYICLFDSSKFWLLLRKWGFWKNCMSLKSVILRVRKSLLVVSRPYFFQKSCLGRSLGAMLLDKVWFLCPFDWWQWPNNHKDFICINKQSVPWNYAAMHTRVDRQCPPLPHFPPQQRKGSAALFSHWITTDQRSTRPKEGDTQASAKEAGNKPIISATLPLHCLPTWAGNWWLILQDTSDFWLCTKFRLRWIWILYPAGMGKYWSIRDEVKIITPFCGSLKNFIICLYMRKIFHVIFGDIINTSLEWKGVSANDKWWMVQ